MSRYHFAFAVAVEIKSKLNVVSPMGKRDYVRAGRTER